ncbi:MAG TPA: SDR family oxidoreductase [Blastocatellia bacterium]|jgi:NAD(P)-dependent dehydrogenase (short-subunit alcohol dehydrogenase family)|nr:SDR family oxidoreductase [Blastocatellia bacterium]
MKNNGADMAGKLCMVTGANSGIGKETAKGLARLGADVVMVCRDRERGRQALSEVREAGGGQNIELMLCDLSSQKSIREFAGDFMAKHSGLDVLINNAGVLHRYRTETEDKLEATFAVNHLAYFLLTNLLLDAVKERAPARIINVSSAAHKYGAIDFDDLQNEKNYRAFNAYSDSKLANVLFTYELARRLEGTRVTANCLHPGGVATNIFHALPRPVEAIIKLVTVSPERGAETSVYLASSPEVEGVSGKYFVKKSATRTSASSYNEDTARRLWDVSAKLAGLAA